MTTTLKGQGVAVLLAYWAELYAPKLVMPTNGEVDVMPGMECSGDDDVTVRAVGYPTPNETAEAVTEAAQVCLDAGLSVRPIDGEAAPYSGFRVRRRPGGAA